MKHSLREARDCFERRGSHAVMWMPVIIQRRASPAAATDYNRITVVSTNYEQLNLSVSGQYLRAVIYHQAEITRLRS